MGRSPATARVRLSWQPERIELFDRADRRETVLRRDGTEIDGILDWLSRCPGPTPTVELNVDEDRPTAGPLLDRLLAAGHPTNATRTCLPGTESLTANGVACRLSVVGLGRLVADFSLGRSQIRLRFGWMNRGCTQLLEALISVLSGSETAEAVWIEEPGSHLFVLTNRTPEVRVEIWHSDGQLFGFSPADEDATCVLDETVELDALAGAVAETTRALLDSRPPSDDPFPLEWTGVDEEPLARLEQILNR